MVASLFLRRIYMEKYNQVKKTINGVEYTAQYNGILAAQDAVDSTYIDGTNTTSIKKMTKYLLENVLVSPKITEDNIDEHFKSVDEISDVIAFLSEVNNGSFQDKTDKTPASAKSKG